MRAAVSGQVSDAEIMRLGDRLDHSRCASRNLTKALSLVDFAGHQEAEFFEAAAIGGQFPDEAALIDHEDAIAEGKKLFELSRNQQDRLIEIALFQHRLHRELTRADVDASRQLIDEQEIGITRKFPGDYEFLLVAAGKALNRRVNAVCSNVELMDQRLSVAFDRWGIEKTKRCERRSVVALQNGVLGQR
jgi:hypothetical protein